MTITKEILVYACRPFKKYRWISYVTIGQVGFMIINLFVIPTPKLIAERDATLKNRSLNDRSPVLNQNTEFDVEITESAPLTFPQKIKKLDYKEIFSLNNIVSNIVERPYFSGAMALTCTLISSALFYRARRSIHLITLLPSDKVRISSFSPLAIGEPPHIEVPLSHVSCLQTRESSTTYTILKVKGRRGTYLLDKNDGEFLEPKLFDEYLGYSRSWADH